MMRIIAVRWGQKMNEEQKKLLELVERAMKGEDNAFEELYKVKARSILLRSTQIMGNWHDGEELSQSVVIAMYRNIHRLRNPGLFNAWLASVISRQGNKMMRKRYKRKDEVNLEDYTESFEEKNREFLPLEYAENEEMKTIIAAVVDTLPDKRRHAIILYYYEEMSCAEVALAMGISEGTVKKTIFEGRKEIKKKLEKKLGEKIDTSYIVSAVPAVTIMKQVLDGLARRTIPQNKVDSFIAVCQDRLKSLPPMAIAAKSAVKPETAGSSGFDVKLAAAVIAATICITGGVLAAIHQNPEPETPPYTAPSSDPGDDMTDTPQLSDEAAAGEDLEINEPAGQSPGDEISENSGSGLAGDGTAADPVFRNEKAATSISGNLYLIDGEGRDLAGGKLLEGVAVQVFDYSNQLVAESVTDRYGTYYIRAELAGDAHYYVSIVIPKDSIITPARENPLGRHRLRLAAGDVRTDINFFLNSIEIPDGVIIFSGGDCECGHVNPKRITIYDLQGQNLEQDWMIARYSDGQVIYTGTGSIIEDPLKELYQQGADGGYIISYIRKNETGNSEEVKKFFWIDTGDIADNEYQ